MGRTPKPTPLKRLHGDRRDRIPANEPIPASGDVHPPEWLKYLGTWNRLAPDLVRKGVLTAWDTDFFARYCWLDHQTSDLMADIQERGKLVPGERGMVKNPATQILRDMTAEMVTIGSRFGLTPADRTKLAKPEAPKDESAERFLSA